MDCKKKSCNGCLKYCSIRDKQDMGWTKEKIKEHYKITDTQYEAAIIFNAR